MSTLVHIEVEIDPSASPRIAEKLREELARMTRYHVGTYGQDVLGVSAKVEREEPRESNHPVVNGGE